MRLLPSSLALCVAALAALGCPKSREPAGDAGVVTVDAGPAPVAFRLQYALADGGGTAPIAPSASSEDWPLLQPTSVLELHATLPLRNYRIRLFDESDRAMVSDDTAEESGSGLAYRITLPEPLEAGHRYTLVIEAQAGDELTDGLGRKLEDVRIAFQVAGEKEKPARRRR
jgi:hypothetical protein